VGNGVDEATCTGKAAATEELCVMKTNGLCPRPPSLMLAVDKGSGNWCTWVRKPWRGRKQRRCAAVKKQRCLVAAAVWTGGARSETDPVMHTVALGRAQIGVQSVSNYSIFAQVLYFKSAAFTNSKNV
jgi:hypothetical protein